MVYIRDIIITESHDREVKHIITALNKILTLKDLGPLTFFL